MSHETDLAAELSPLAWRDGALWLLDQTRLPAEELWIACRRPEEVAAAIRRLAVRGAPAIGVAAAYGLVLAVEGAAESGGEGRDWAVRLEAGAALLAATRPTAVNLRWAIDRGRAVFAGALPQGAAAARAALAAWAADLHRRDVEINRAMGEHGAELFARGDRVLTHCNTGALATAGIGTALGVIRAAWRRGAVAHVWVDETRPLLQGARLTAWELQRLGVPYQVITDSSAGALMAAGRVDRVVVGADRIAANGDTANKIGTYTVAVLAARHGVPFYVAAPLSTVDLATPTGAEIPIEERAEDEVTQVMDRRVTPEGARALNLAFDVTPHELIAAMITETGVLRPPYTESLAGAFRAETEAAGRGPGREKS